MSQLSTPAARPSRLVWAAIAGFVLLFSAAGYGWLGNRAGWHVGPGDPGRDPAESARGEAAPHQISAAKIDAMLETLAQRLKEQPDDAQGWQMLGRSYATLGRFPQAVEALRKLVALQPTNAQGLADLADALAMQQDRNFAGEPTQLISRALAADPDNLKALAIAGTIAFERGDQAGARRHWEHAVRVGPPESALVNAMRENLEELRGASSQGASSQPSQAGVGKPAALTQATEKVSSGQPAAANHVAILGWVELAPALAAQAKPDDTVFIFARPAQGARMPLAILKKQVRDLPLDFRLDDSLAMSPAARLSGASAVIVSARVAKSGQAMPQPGDLQGQSTSVPPGTSGLRIVIDEVVK